MHCIVLFFIHNEYRAQSVRYLVYPVNLMDSVYLIAHIVIDFIVIDFIVLKSIKNEPLKTIEIMHEEKMKR